MKIGDLEIEEQVFVITKKMLVRYGVRGWNMDDLAHECSMSKRTLYKIIGNKEELIYKCYENNFTSSYADLSAYLNKTEDYVAILSGLAERVSKYIDDFIIAGQETIKNEYPRVGDLIRTRVKMQQKLLVDFFQNGQEKGMLKDVITVNSIIHIINALMEYHITHSKNKGEFQNDIQQELNFIFKGLIV